MDDNDTNYDIDSDNDDDNDDNDDDNDDNDDNGNDEGKSCTYTWLPSFLVFNAFVTRLTAIKSVDDKVESLESIKWNTIDNGSLTVM